METEKFCTFFNVKSFCYYFWKHDGIFLYRFVETVLAVSSVLCISISCDLINCYSCRIQRTEIIKFSVKKLRW